MKVQRFYKRGDTSVHYDIPYAEDEFTPRVLGTAAVTTDNGNYILATTVRGEDSSPAGGSVSSFLQPFRKEKDISRYGYHVFPLEGTNGGSVTIDGVRYETPVIVIRNVGDAKVKEQYFIAFNYGYDVDYEILRGACVGGDSGKWNEIFRPQGLPSLPDDTDYDVEYGATMITRRSIMDTIKLIYENNSTVNENIVCGDSNYYVYSCSVSNTAHTIRGNCEIIANMIGSCAINVWSTLNAERYHKIITGMKYDDVEIDDDEGSYDNDGGDGGTGTGNIPTGEDIEEPDKPGKNGASTGLLRGYVLSQEQVTKFSSWLWTADVIDYISKLFTSNPLDSIITFSMLPYTPSTSVTGTSIILGGKACTEVPDALLINEQFSTFEFTYDGLTEPVWGNALDFEKGVRIELFIPFVGIVPLDVNSVIYTKLKLKYIIDCFSGQGIVYLVSQKSDSTWDGERKKCLLGQWTFNCKSTLPLTRNDISSIISGAIGGITSLATGNIGGVASAVMSARPSVQRSGDVATSTAYMGKRNPYIIYTMSKAIIPKGSYGKIGRPQYAIKTLGDCDGFIQCKNPRMSFTGGDGQSPTDEEIKEIYSLLEEGVVV